MTYSRRISISLLLVLSSLGFVSCGSKAAQGPVKHFPLTLALAGPIGDMGNPLPDDIKTVLMPIQVKNCAGILFIPDVKLLRIDLEGVQPVELDLGQEQNAIQRAAGQAPNPEKARSIREQALQKQQITSLMAQPEGTEKVTNENLKKLLASSTNEHVFTYAGTQRAFRLLNVTKITIANDTNDLFAKIGSTFCNRPGEKPAAQLQPAIVIYKPGTAIDDTAIAQSAEPQGNKTLDDATASTAGTQTQPSKENADAALNQLSSEIQTAANDPAKKKSVHAQLTKAQAEFSWDYRFTYERAKLAVYGKAHHDEAFYHLYRAAEIAINNGDSDRMAQALESDSNGPFQNLTDHSEWQTVLNALRTRNSELVRK